MTDYIDKLKKQITPSNMDMTGYIIDFHNHYPGITEKIIGKRLTSSNQSSYAILVDSLLEPKGKTVVDLACGSGPLTKLCVEKIGKEGRVIAVDLSEQELTLAKKKIKENNVTFLCEPAQNLSIANSSVDAVLCHVAFNLMRPIEPVVREIRRVLKPKGMFHAVIGGLEHNALLYKEFCGILDEIIRQEIPHFLESGLGDPRTTTIDGLRSLFDESFYFENKLNFNIEFIQDSKSLASEVIRYFYPFYFLSKPAQTILEVEALKLFEKHESADGLVTFQIPQVRISIRKMC